MTGDEMRAALIEAMESSARGNTYAQWTDTILPVVRKIASRQAGQVLRAAAQEQRNEAEQVPDTDEGTHADGHRCAADFLDRHADALDPS